MGPMDIKLVVLDMDGTLLDNTHQVTQKNKATMKKLMKQGVQFILASGRPYESMEPYIKDLGMDLPVIAANGAFVKSPIDDKVYINSGVPLDLSQEIIDYGLEQGYAVSVYYEDGLSTFDEKMVDVHMELEGIDAQLTQDSTIIKPPNKIIYYDNPERIMEAFKIMEKSHGEKLYVTCSGELYLDFMNLQASKGNAVELLMDEMGLSKDQVMVVGNNYNDLAMFEHVGLAIAMENSPLEVKNQSDYVTKSNVEDGVAFALERFIK